jgi:hypothetical protein
MTEKAAEETKKARDHLLSMSQSLEIAEAKLAGNTEEAFKLSAAFAVGAATFNEMPKSAQVMVERLYAIGEQQKKNNEEAIQAERDKRDAEAESAKIRADLDAESAKIRADLDAEFSKVESGAGDSVKTEMERIQERYQAEREIVQSHFAMMMESEMLHGAELEEEKRRHAAVMTGISIDQAEAEKAIEDQKAKAQKQAVSGAFSNLSQLMNTESRKLFEIGKAAAISNSIINTIQAATKALAEVPYPFNFAVAATTAAAGFANVKQIQSTQFGSASTGQSIQGGQVVNNTSAQQQQPNRNISISIAGDNFSGDSVRSLINAINEEVGDGAKLSIGG